MRIQVSMKHKSFSRGHGKFTEKGLCAKKRALRVVEKFENPFSHARDKWNDERTAINEAKEWTTTSKNWRVGIDIWGRNLKLFWDFLQCPLALIPCISPNMIKKKLTKNLKLMLDPTLVEKMWKRFRDIFFSSSFWSPSVPKALCERGWKMNSAMNIEYISYTYTVRFTMECKKGAEPSESLLNTWNF